ncbi:MAG: helix-turn-helix domain-containing protein [Succinivibrionaceae bacterium]|nr:helix-turn-helix domain-containing protein [Succinivibrionaceae bacterium]
MSFSSYHTSYKIYCNKYLSEGSNLNLYAPNVVLTFRSLELASELECPRCGCKHVVLDRTRRTVLNDVPYLPGATKSLEVFYNVYECQDCGKCFTQDIDFKHPLARITHRAAQWICALIKEGYSIKSVAALTGICWETIKRIVLGLKS